MIDHGKSAYSLYAHLQPGSVRVHVGAQVKAGDVIGNSTQPHCTFTCAINPTR
jgi:murein DD-endopeptidase MepM/ murein hydrolase activator NlpD